MKFSHKARILGVTSLLIMLFAFLFSSNFSSPNKVRADIDPYAEQSDPSYIPGPAVPLPSGPGSDRNFRPAVSTVTSTKESELSLTMSNLYAVWVAQSVATNPIDDINGTLDDTADIKGRDLISGSSIIISDAPGRQDSPAISGSIVVWQQRAANCTDCKRDIVGKDLATGATLNVATTSNDETSPTINGTTVAWLESNSTSVRLLFRQITNSVSVSTQVVSLSHANGTLLPPVISANYIVWAEVGAGDANTRLHTVVIKAYDRNDSTTQEVARYKQDEWDQPEYSLSGKQLLWNQDGLQLHDLSNGISIVLTVPNNITASFIKDNTVFISVDTGVTGYCQDIYGIDLSNPAYKAVPLVAGPGCDDGPTTANDSLMWVNINDSIGQINTAVLSTAFASANNRQADINNRLQQQQTNTPTIPTQIATQTTDSTPTFNELPTGPNYTSYLKKGIYAPNGLGWLQPNGQACSTNGACPAIDAMGATQSTPYFGSYVILSSDLNYDTTTRLGVNIRPNSLWGPQVRYTARYLSSLGKRVLIRYYPPEGYLSPPGPDPMFTPVPTQNWTPALIATDVVGQLAWRSWVKDLVIHNEPNNDREWKPYCTGCTWPGRNRTYNWSNYLDRQFFEAVRDFYVDVYYNINYYRTDPNYCTNIDPVRCNNLRNMSLWNPPMAPIYRYINYSTESPYSVMAGMIMLYGHFSYNLYSSPVYTRPELQGILLNNAWTRISESSLASAITYGGFPSQIQEFGWDPYKVSLCYNHNQLWPALPPNGKCVPGDRLNHTFASDLVNFMDSTERHNAQTINAYHIRGDNKEHLPDGNPNDGLTNWGSLLWPNIGFGWLYSYQLGSPGP